jgi:hypothetical protein
MGNAALQSAKARDVGCSFLLPVNPQRAISSAL